MSGTTKRPTSHADPARPGPVRECVCADDPIITATFTNQNLTRLALEHCWYCPCGPQLLDIGAYLARGERVSQ